MPLSTGQLIFWLLHLFASYSMQYVPFDDLYLHNSMLGCVHEQKARGLQWVESIGVASKKAVFVTLVGLAKQSKQHNGASY